MLFLIAFNEETVSIRSVIMKSCKMFIPFCFHDFRILYWLPVTFSLFLIVIEVYYFTECNELQEDFQYRN
jgi:hypothetical protein